MATLAFLTRTARIAARRCSTGAPKSAVCAASITAGSSTRSGTCVDMPSEPPESDFKDRLTIKAYPTYEVGGLVWVVYGPAGAASPSARRSSSGPSCPHSTAGA